MGAAQADEIEQADRDLESDLYNSGVKYSVRVTDNDTLDFLNSQDTVTSYKTMQLVDGQAVSSNGSSYFWKARRL